MTIRQGALAAAVLCLAFAAPPAAAKDMIYGSCVPAGDYLTSDALPAMFEQIAKETGGAINWKAVTGGQIADCKTTFTAVQDGLMEAGLAIPVYVPHLVPSTALLYSTIEFEGETVAVAGASLETLILDCPSCMDEWKKLNSLPLGAYASSPYRLYCTSKIDSVAGLKGKRVRAAGGSLEFFKIAGAVPVNATLPEAVTLLQRGGLDCLYGVAEWLKTYSYGDSAKYVVDVPLGTTGPAIGVDLNRDAWAGMTHEEREVTLRASALFSAKHSIGNFVLKNDTSLKEVIADKGVELVPVGDDFAKLIADYKSGERAASIANARTLGVAEPEAILDAYEENLKKWRGLEKEIGTDIDKFAKAIWDEVYSKVDVDKL